MKTRKRAPFIVALATTVALFAAACADGGTAADLTPAPPETEYPVDPTEVPAPSDDTVTITWWHNGSGEPLYSFWHSVADSFMEANPGVYVEITVFSGEDLRSTDLPWAWAAGNPPDVFQSWGGAELRSWFQAGYLKDVSDFLPAPVLGAAESFRIGDGIFGVPYTALPSGFWVNMNLWEQAGLTEADFPVTLDDLFDAWDALKEAGITPVAVGGADGWPAAHWWYWTALRSVSPTAMQSAIMYHDFSDQGWLDTSDLLQTILDRNAFNADWQETHAQMGLDSASAQVVLGQAAMQLMGTWDFGVMGGIYAEANDVSLDALNHIEFTRWFHEDIGFIRWFPFPAVTGAAGDPTAIMGGIDGFSVSANAPVEAAKFLAYIVSTDVQTRYAAMGNIPVNPGATHAMPSGPLDDAAVAVANASSVHLWLDTVFAPAPAPIHDPITAFMKGETDAQGLVDALVALFG